METTDTAFEAEVGVEQEALHTAQSPENELQKGKRAARVANTGIQIPPSPGYDDEEPGESSPLLASAASEDPPPWRGMDDFAHLPKWRQPNILWVLVPFFLMASAFGGVITPKVNLILELVCQRYMSERQLAVYLANPAAGSRFLGTAVHKATAEMLRTRYPSRFIYKLIGPDFLDTTTGKFIELAIKQNSWAL